MNNTKISILLLISIATVFAEFPDSVYRDNKGRKSFI